MQHVCVLCANWVKIIADEFMDLFVFTIEYRRESLR